MCYNNLGDNMFSIKDKTVNEIVIKKSRFIAIALPVKNENSVKENLKILKKEYPNANHYTYAYILEDDGLIQKATDDGEPSRTAGYPILEVLLRQNLTYILLVVIRYFGGIKLGTGGLIRAYTYAASEVLKRSKRTQKETIYTCKITTDYNHIGNIDKYLREHTNLINVAYDTDITFIFEVNALNYDQIKEQLFNKNNFENHLEVIKKFSEYV